MEKLKKAEEIILQIKEKRKQEDIKTCFSNLKSLSDVLNDLNKIHDSIFTKIKEKLIEECNKEKEYYIEKIIFLSYNSFKDKIDIEDSRNELEQLLLDIQKSSFYQEYKNDIRIQLMEINMPRENIDFRDAITKLKILQKKFFDEYLSKDIEEDIKAYECEIANKELKEVKELLKNKEFGIVLDKMDKLLKEMTYSENFQITAENYIEALENKIEKKIEEGNKKISELEIFENFLNKNKYKLNNYKFYKEKLKALKKNKISIKQEMDVIEMGEYFFNIQ